MARFVPTLIAGALALGAATQAQAYVFGFSVFDTGNVLTINGSDPLANTSSGWYSASGTHDSANLNYFAGTCCGNPDNLNNFFVFDISALQAPVSSLSFTVNAATVSDLHDYRIYDYKGSIATLVAGSAGTAAYDDLASGNSYGGGTLSVGDSNTYVTFQLNDFAIADLNAAIAAKQAQFAFGGTILPVPELNSGLMMLSGLALMAALRKRKPA